MSKSQNEASDPHVVTEDDGYTLTRYIEGVPRMYGSLRFTYRPVGSIGRSRFRAKAPDGEREEDSIRRYAKAAVSRMVEWNAVDRKGEPLPLTDKSIVVLHPMLQMRLFNVIIHSIDGGDDDPAKTVYSEPDIDDDPFGGAVTDDEIVAESRKN